MSHGTNLGIPSWVMQWIEGSNLGGTTDSGSGFFELQRKVKEGRESQTCNEMNKEGRQGLIAKFNCKNEMYYVSPKSQHRMETETTFSIKENDIASLQRLKFINLIIHQHHPLIRLGPHYNCSFITRFWHEWVNQIQALRKKNHENNRVINIKVLANINH